MDRDNPLDDVDDAQLVAAFAHIDAPQLPPDFTAKTMRAVRRAPLPAGRVPLRDPLLSMFGWAALIASVAFAVLAISLGEPIVVAAFSRLITRGVGTGMWLLQLAPMGLRLFEVMATMGDAVSRAAMTAQGATGLVMSAVVGAVSLSGLHRVLISEREDSQWQELS
jgi:hypothetical protein